MSRFSLVMILAASVNGHATLAKYRVLNRNSVFCSTLLSSMRALSTPESQAEAINAFRDFRLNVLKAAPVLRTTEIQAVRAHGKISDPVSNQALVQRVYAVERSFDNPEKNDEFVVATATFSADEFNRLTQSMAAARDHLMAEAKRSDKPRLSLGALSPYIANLTQYYYWGSFFASQAAATSFLMTSWSAMLVAHDPLSPRAVASYGTLLALAGIGTFDYPLRHIRSHQYGYQKIVKTLGKFSKGSEDWTYWSRDVLISPEFAQQLMMTGQSVRWDTILRDEDYREQASGAWRLYSDHNRKKANRNYIHFSVDILARRIDGVPHVTIVLRSQPSLTPAIATQPDVVPSFAGGTIR